MPPEDLGAHRLHHGRSVNFSLRFGLDTVTMRKGSSITPAPITVTSAWPVVSGTLATA